MLLRRVVRTELSRLLHDLLFQLFQKKVRLLQLSLLFWIFKGALFLCAWGPFKGEKGHPYWNPVHSPKPTGNLHLGLGSLLLEFRLAREPSPTKSSSLCGARDAR